MLETKENIEKALNDLNSLLVVAAKQSLTVDLKIDDNDDLTALCIKAKYSVSV